MAKKAFSFILFIIFAFTAVPAVYASSKNIVYGDIVFASPGDEIEIPLYIENNEGFMGFAVNVEYDGNSISAVSARRGGLLTSGLFNNSITDGTVDGFRIVFCDVKEVVGDGELAVICFRIDENASDDQTIGLSYTKNDTFGENWNDIEFCCENIKVKLNGNISEELNALIIRLKEFIIKVTELLGYMVQSVQVSR